MNKKLVAFITSMCFMTVLGFGSAFAAEENNVGQQLEVAYGETVEVSRPEAQSSSVDQMDGVDTGLTVDESDVAPNTSLKSTPSIINMNTRSTSNEFSFTGTIGTQGQFAWVYPITLANGQIVQAMLECPNNANLDYDLYLYEFDAANQSIVGNALAISAYKTLFNTYPNGTSKTLEEAIGYVNTSGGVKSYALGVYAKTGSSTTDSFGLKVSLDYPSTNEDGSIHWPYEINESQNAANVFGVLNTNSTVSNGKINSLSDNDWFQINTPANFGTYAEYFNIDVLTNEANSTTANTHCEFELYKTTDGQSMTLIPKNALGSYTVSSAGVGSSGTYYLRIIPSSTFSSYTEYTLKTSHDELPATQLLITGFDSIGGPNNFETLTPWGRGYWLPYNANWVAIEGYVANENGVKIDKSSFANQIVSAVWSSGGWNNLPDNDPIFGNKYSNDNDNNHKIKNDNTFRVRINGIPPAEGRWSNHGSVYVSTFDIDTVTVYLKDSPAMQCTRTFYHGADVY